MTTYNPGDILLLHFPFTDVTGVKQRPALVVLDSGDDDIIVARVTRQRGSSPYDVNISDWSTSGLLAPSIVRLHKLASLNKSLVNRPLGQLSATDQAAVKAVLHHLFDSFA